MIGNFTVEYQKKIKVFKGTGKKSDLSENNINVTGGPELFFQYNSTNQVTQYQAKVSYFLEIWSH